MKVFLVVFFLINGVWVQGEDSKGWGALEFKTEEACLVSRDRGNNINTALKKSKPLVIEKRFECIVILE